MAEQQEAPRDVKDVIPSEHLDFASNILASTRSTRRTCTSLKWTRAIRSWMKAKPPISWKSCSPHNVGLVANALAFRPSA
ncbi:MAG: hypothetical protein CM15mP74_33650 [Halieaceae bacterium]|nr:MAG: hypothetical protein CM15mP74_33650 [Halieaceae bacterium]